MRVSGAGSGGSEVSSSQKAAIKRQIRKLEEKRDEILEKLGLKKPSKKQESTGVSGGTWTVNSTPSIGQEGVAAPQIDGATVETGAVAPAANVAPTVAQDVGSALLARSKEIVSSADSTELSEDREELVAQLKAIEMQIMALRKQINDDSVDVPEVDTEKAAELAASGMMARESGRSTESVAAPPSVEVTPTGNVDGYV